MEIVLLKLSCVWFSTSCGTYTRIATPLTMEAEIIPDSRGYFIIFNQYETSTYCVKYVYCCPIPQRFECIFELFVVIKFDILDPENEVRSFGHCFQIMCLHFHY
jgi:hypothetical protein